MCSYDPQTAFRIDVKIEGYFNKQKEGRKEYLRGTRLKWVVDSDKFSICELISDLKDHEIYWGECQRPRIWITDKNESKKSELVCESQIPEMFRMHEKDKRIYLLIVIGDLDGNTKCSGTNVELLSTPPQPMPPIALGSQSQIGSTKEPDINLIDEQPDLQPDGNVSAETNLEPIIDAELTLSTISHDPDNPIIELNALFPDAAAFRKALRHFAIKCQFEFITIKSDKTRFMAKCKEKECPWRIRAFRLRDNKTFKVTVLPFAHTCANTNMKDGKSMVSKSWISERAADWLRKDPTAGPTTVRNKLQHEYKVKISYGKVWRGRRSALDQIYGSWEESFQLLYNFKAELEKSCPGSIVEINCEKVGSKMLFSKVFVVLKEGVHVWKVATVWKPCIHAIAFICSIRGARMEDYVDEFFSIERYRNAYKGVISPIADSSQWPKVDPGFSVHPPRMKRPAGRPRKQRIQGCLEIARKKQQCKRCKKFGHQQRTCKESLLEDAPNDGSVGNKRKQGKRQRGLVHEDA